MTPDDYTVDISADDGVNGPVADNFRIRVSLDRNRPPQIDNPGAKTYEQGETITAFDIPVTDQEDTVTVTVTGLPSGLSFTPNHTGGRVSGTVAATAAAQDYTVEISAEDGANDGGDPRRSRSR